MLFVMGKNIKKIHTVITAIQKRGCSSDKTI